ncbi:hypothetical protein SYNPS1DRAFT_27307 [Syncephalis pseudoplumigaleata]|uniref:Uncharacterized protein n=1 Tax=Syncephalis pseudoplumigaleata TaxID=1712513 RepID=A0A4P9Z4N8_9FUNG|nr:hypothetical protein SYNPS1DRAFT_27307 [Syncephalis pseudoplumigaleata]|eukprot:RKP27032.1 hypothetical protein SYNPS1DRAFT_27307 [Syncephalis pseudoplumigaleata]
MPRIAKRTLAQSTTRQSPYFGRGSSESAPSDDDHAKESTIPVYYPRSAKERKEYVNPLTGRRVTDFQYRVYDLCAQIPEGYYATYKLLSDMIKGSPRAGSSLQSIRATARAVSSRAVE